jgi:dTMP kinase
MINYPFIVFEGIDHSGKTTVSKKIAESYRDFKWAHEPVFPSEFADKLNSDEYKEFPAKREVLFLEGRLGRQNFYNGNPVILDRYLWSGMAYAKAFSPSIYPFCQELYQNYRIFKKPTLYFFMDTPVDVCLSRRTPDSKETEEKLALKRQAYAETEQFVNSPIVYIDGKASVDECVEQCLAALREHCPKYFI